MRGMLGRRYVMDRIGFAVALVLMAVRIAVGGGAWESTGPGDGSVVIEGDSNVKSWTVRGEDIRGRIEAAEVTGEGVVERWVAGPTRAEVRIAVSSLTGGSRGMDRRMREVLRADEHPDIRFRLGKLHRGDPAEDGPTPTGTAEGELTVAGHSRTLRFPVTITETAGGLEIQGEVALKMTDFGIDPPRALLGALRTDDDVLIRFEWRPAAAP